LNKQITQETIEAIMLRLQTTPDLFSSLLDGLEREQPAIINWIFSESFDILNQEEKQYFLFLSLVIIVAISEELDAEDAIDPKRIELAEEKNWEVFTSQSSKEFREKINVFFDAYPQEDLLAFVEDALELEQEDQVVTTIGRPPMFMALKTIIDILAIEPFV
jgi:hypothetical protein